jgi:tRNA(Ile)-lysidine synthase
LVERFRAALGRLNPDGGPIGLAVSGGPDSMAMLLLAHAAIPGGFEVATVDHGLRAEAKDECALVALACAQRQVPCEILTVQVGPGNVQARAREARYAALKEWALRRGLSAIVTAHHADDQAETLMMRLNRGSGLAGLAGVRAAQHAFPLPHHGIRILRPLLEFRRSELAQVVTRSGSPFVCDPSNLDQQFDRVRMRQAIARADWLEPDKIAQSAELLAEALDAMDHLVMGEFADGAVRQGDQAWRYFPGTHRFIEIEVIARIFGELGRDVSRSDIVRLRDRLSSGKNASLAGILAAPGTGEFRESDGKTSQLPFWDFRPEPPRRTG